MNYYDEEDYDVTDFQGWLDPESAKNIPESQRRPPSEPALLFLTRFGNWCHLVCKPLYFGGQQ